MVKCDQIILLYIAIRMYFFVAGNEGEIIDTDFFGNWGKGLIIFLVIGHPVAMARVEEIKYKIQNCCDGGSDSQHSESGSGTVRLIGIAASEPFD